MSLANLKGLVRRFSENMGLCGQAVRHLMVGGTGVIFNWFIFSALRQNTELSTLQCTLLVHAVLLFTIFPIQKFFTFRNIDRARPQMARFLINDFAYVSMDFLLANLFIDILQLQPIVGKAIGLMILTPMSFAMQRFWVFRDSFTHMGSKNATSGTGACDKS
jgi:putative flippase GtrA